MTPLASTAMSGDMQIIVGALAIVLFGLVVMMAASIFDAIVGPLTQRSCSFCGGVAIPGNHVCPECFAEHHHVQDPFENES